MTGDPEYSPFQHAEALGVEIQYRDLPPGEFGRWYNHRRLVVLRPGMRPAHEQCVLAHELGHAAYGHVSSTPKTELQADRFAASNLINFAMLMDAAEKSQNEAEVCLELGVTVRLLRVYLTMYRLTPFYDPEAPADGLFASVTARRPLGGRGLPQSVRPCAPSRHAPPQR